MTEQPGEQDDRYSRRDTYEEEGEPRPVTPDLPPPEELSDTSLDVPVDTAESTGRPAEDLDPDGAAPEPPA
jgi:hypothetical protein